MFCSYCGAPIEGSAEICPKCGKAVVRVKDSEDPPRFCRECGEKIPEGAASCPHCNAAQDRSEKACGPSYSEQTQSEGRLLVTPWGKEVTDDKSVVLGLILSILIPGLGTMYSGRIVRGLCLFFGTWGIGAVSIWIVRTGVDFDSVGMILGGVLFLFVAMLALYVYAVYDGYRNCETVHDLYQESIGRKS